MLFKTPRLGDPERRVIALVDDLRERLGYATSAKRWQGLLRRNTLAKAIQGSNGIEGYNVTVDDAIAAAEGEEPLDADAETWAAITGYRQAMTYVINLSDDPHFSYSASLLKTLHFMMVHYDLPKHPGRWRTAPVFVRNDRTGAIVYEGPDWESVPPLMDELIAELTDRNQALPSVVRAAMAHLNLVMVHPFSDGNGRMARCLQTLVLARTGNISPMFCSIEEYLGKNTQPYYDVLAEVGGGSWRPKRDARPWVRFCLTAHYRQAVTLLLRTKELAKTWEAMEEEARRRGLSDRVVPALADAASGLKVRNAMYRQQADVTDQVASRDLKQLVDEKLLVPVGERRGRYYVAHPRIREIATRFREPRVIPDPFAQAAPHLPGMEPR